MVEAADKKQKVAPPYVAFRTLWNFLDRLGEVGTPPRIDRSVWGDSLSGAYGSQLMAALRFLKLIDEEGNADPDLKRMAEDPTLRKSILWTRLTDAYAPAISGLDLSTATSQQLKERFQSTYSVTAATFEKAMGFFVQAAQAAGMPLSPYIARKTRQRQGARAKPRRRNLHAPAKTGTVDIQSSVLKSIDGGVEGSERIVTLQSGGTLKMILSVNPFKLSRADRDFVFDIIDKIQEYEGSKSPLAKATENLQALAERRGRR